MGLRVGTESGPGPRIGPGHVRGHMVKHRSIWGEGVRVRVRTCV